ncbi:MAG: proline--tRNA ligase [Clostridia bacterium]|nr:proline--tRNA ligase [Clostridia bacterium]
MKMSKMHFNTLREDPNEAEIPSHKLLLRAGMIRKLVSGVYGFMPMGYKVLKKIEQIVREEMDAKGAQEIFMSAIQPAELWQESGRWYDFGPEMFRLKDRHDREFCLGPTHEEIFTDIIRDEVNSHRQLPLNLYQIQTKYRDEKRPRFGLMRSREFIMKDAYSFDKDWEGLDKSYDEMYDAYDRVFTRCKLNFRPVEADTGAMGGSGSHEFTALSEVGEGVIAYCHQCDFAATSERAECKDEKPSAAEEMQELKEVPTPAKKTIEEVAAFLDIPAHKTIKTLLFKAGDEIVAAVLRGDRELNETKLVNALAIPEHLLEFAGDEEVQAVTKAATGFAGPIGLEGVKLIVDSELVHMKNLTAGANKTDYHIQNVNYDRDYKSDIVKDIKLIDEGYPCPKCNGSIKLARGIEVGQVFKLGTKYSKAMGAIYRDEKMQEQNLVMGCYGIGVTRTMAAIIEQHHDDNGIIWPVAVAPYHAVITIIKTKDVEQTQAAEKIYQQLTQSGVEVLLDDRDERAGVKFKDADLVGIPIRITVGKKASKGIVEFKLRREPEVTELSIEEAANRTISIVQSEK